MEKDIAEMLALFLWLLGTAAIIFIFKIFIDRIRFNRNMNEFLKAILNVIMVVYALVVFFWFVLSFGMGAEPSGYKTVGTVVFMWLFAVALPMSPLLLVMLVEFLSGRIKAYRNRKV